MKSRYSCYVMSRHVMSCYTPICSDKKRTDDDLDLDSLDLETPIAQPPTSHGTQHATLQQSMDMIKKLCGMWKGNNQLYMNWVSFLSLDMWYRVMSCLLCLSRHRIFVCHDVCDV